VTISSLNTGHPENDNSQEDCQSPSKENAEINSRPTRAAAVKGRTRMTEWTKTLRRPEDVIN